MFRGKKSWVIEANANVLQFLFDSLNKMSLYSKL